MRILVFGASTTYGKEDREGGWVQRIRKLLDEKVLADEGYFLVYNLGVSGDDTENLLKRFELETRHRLEEKLEEKEEVIFIFEIGANDSQFIHSENILRVPLEKFKDNIKFLINSAKQFSQKITFIGLTPVDESKTTPIPWYADASYKNEYIRKYDEIIKKVCEENQVNYIEIFNKLTVTDLEDGVHPNSQGHQKIFELVKNYLIDNKIINV